ncbi:ester cyclase [Arenibacter certesii]|uniref:Polyketide cyclase n=1 Tax=Arenibacter certesii TaxID=228955 RepID=A0A918MN49_9FLAO|nr:ester cyclase [Arenibacter certesii]GGW40397.1 hypothetical protein GCM10007383_26390 [Arenibacter certesii]
MKWQTFLIALVVLFFISCKNETKSLDNDVQMDNGKIMGIKEQAEVKNFVDQYLNTINDTLLDGRITDNYIRYMNGIPIATNKTELNAKMTLYAIGFPNYSIDKTFTEVCGNRAFIQWEFTGTNTGEFAEVIATGKKVHITGFSQLHFNMEGELFQEDIYFNQLDFLQQLGYSLSPPNLN